MKKDPWINKEKPIKESQELSLETDLARADDDGFAISGKDKGG
jgi:hypothetical protein